MTMLPMPEASEAVAVSVTALEPEGVEETKTDGGVVSITGDGVGDGAGVGDELAEQSDDDHAQPVPEDVASVEPV